MIGQVYDNLYNSDILIIKTDTAGNEIWKKKIGVAGIDENALKIDILQNNLIISGYKTSHNANAYSGFVMRLDTAANVIWNKTLNTNFGGGGNAKILKDGNIAICSQYREYTTGTDRYTRFQIEKITPNNVTLWSKKMGQIGLELGISSIIESKQGNIVVDGQVAYNTANGVTANGIVWVVNQNGDSLFTREFYYQQGCQNYFRDMIQASDGGYCFAGFFIPLYANSQCVGTQDIWLLKVDSNFCESAIPCTSNVGITNYTKDEGVKVYPNPANNELYFVFNIEEAKTITVDLFDINGRLLLSKTYDNAKEPHRLDIENIANGLYFYKIATGQKLIKTNKVVIIK